MPLTLLVSVRSETSILIEIISFMSACSLHATAEMNVWHVLACDSKSICKLYMYLLVHGHLVHYFIIIRVICLDK